MKPLSYTSAMMGINFKRELDTIHLELALSVEIGRKKTYCAVSCRIVKNSAIYRRYQRQKQNNQILYGYGQILARRTTVSLGIRITIEVGL